MLDVRFYTRCTGLRSFFSLIDTRESRKSIVVATMEYDPLRSWTSPGAFGLANWQEFSWSSDVRRYLFALSQMSSFACIGPDVLEIRDLRLWPQPPDYLRVVDCFSPSVLRDLEANLEAGTLVLAPFDAVLENPQDRWTLAYLLEETLFYRGEEILLLGGQGE